jgi:hypothetical protein
VASVGAELGFTGCVIGAAGATVGFDLSLGCVVSVAADEVGGNVAAGFTEFSYLEDGEPDVELASSGLGVVANTGALFWLLPSEKA